MTYLLIFVLSFVSFINLAETTNLELKNTHHQNFKELFRPIIKQKKKNLKNQNLHEFIPKGYAIYEEIYGDLNKDGIEDCVLIIKGTDKNEIIEDEYRGELDRNRRGIIVLLRQKGVITKWLLINDTIAFPLSMRMGAFISHQSYLVEIDRGKLYVNYLHGRYGYWKYTFSYEKSDFKLIRLRPKRSIWPDNK
jgi:hypothetical protein